MLSVAVQHAVGGTALAAPWLVSNGASSFESALDHASALTEPVSPRCSRHGYLSTAVPQKLDTEYPESK